MKSISHLPEIDKPTEKGDEFIVFGNTNLRVYFGKWVRWYKCPPLGKKYGFKIKSFK